MDNHLTQNNDKKSLLASFISFFIPTIGIILYFLKRRKEPNLAKSFRTGVKVRLIFIAVMFIIQLFLGLYFFNYFLYSYFI